MCKSGDGIPLFLNLLPITYRKVPTNFTQECAYKFNANKCTFKDCK